jgi:hypothetical protein
VISLACQIIRRRPLKALDNILGLYLNERYITFFLPLERFRLFPSLRKKLLQNS